MSGCVRYCQDLLIQILALQVDLSRESVNCVRTVGELAPVCTSALENGVCYPQSTNLN
jgi:hypothetical protein